MWLGLESEDGDFEQKSLFTIFGSLGSSSYIFESRECSEIQYQNWSKFLPGTRIHIDQPTSYQVACIQNRTMGHIKRQEHFISTCNIQKLFVHCAANGGLMLIDCKMIWLAVHLMALDSPLFYNHQYCRCLSLRYIRNNP